MNASIFCLELGACMSIACIISDHRWSETYSHGKNIGTMSDKKWNDFFTIMAENNVYDKTLNWKEAYTLDFIKEGN